MSRGCWVAGFFTGYKAYRARGMCCGWFRAVQHALKPVGVIFPGAVGVNVEGSWGEVEVLCLLDYVLYFLVGWGRREERWGELVVDRNDIVRYGGG